LGARTRWRDTATFDRLIAPGFVYTEDATVMNKEELIRSIMADRVISARNEEMKVHAYRDTAVVTYSGEIRLDKSRTGVDVDLTQHRVA